MDAQPDTRFENRNARILLGKQVYREDLETVLSPSDTGFKRGVGPILSADTVDVSMRFITTGFSRLMAWFRLMSPLNWIILASILIIWLVVWYENYSLQSTGEYNPGTASPQGTFDGQRRNDYTTVKPREGTYVRNFDGSGLLCDFLGWGCRTYEGGVLMKETKRPYFTENIPTGGFHIFKYRQNTTGPSMTMSRAMSKDACKGLTQQEAMRYFCDRDILSPKWYRIAATTNDACSVEIDLEGCGQWRACLNTIAATHFGSTFRNSLGLAIKVSDSMYLDFPEMDCTKIISKNIGGD
ncbi:MAG: hypothetical protein K0U52_11145 [Gammaproteobacteria bacterium]|nr:hypothetical protein [Gammaproteobacteria bacterium]